MNATHKDRVLAFQALHRRPGAFVIANAYVRLSRWFGGHQSFHAQLKSETLPRG